MHKIICVCCVQNMKIDKENILWQWLSWIFLHCHPQDLQRQVHSATTHILTRDTTPCSRCTSRLMGRFIPTPKTHSLNYRAVPLISPRSIDHTRRPVVNLGSPTGQTTVPALRTVRGPRNCHCQLIFDINFFVLENYQLELLLNSKN